MNARRSARPVAALAGLALLIAACGGGAATTAGPTTGAAATQAPVTEAPAATLGPGLSFVIPTFHSDQALEATLPKTLGGKTVTVQSLSGDQFLGDGTSSPAIQAALTALGKTAADLSVAYGSVDQVSFSIIAFRVQGAAGSALFAAFETAAQLEGTTTSGASFGGKSVTKVTPTDDSGASYVYASGDTVFVVGGDDATDALLNETFAALP